MKLFIVLCLFGAFAATLAVPQEHPQVGVLPPTRPTQELPQVGVLPPTRPSQEHPQIAIRPPAPNQDRPQVGVLPPTRPVTRRQPILNMENPFSRPSRPGMHAPPPPPTMVNGQRPQHPIAPQITPELHNLMKDIRDFLNLYPRREIRNLIREHVRDPELRATMKFIRTPEFKIVMRTIAETAEFKAIGQYFATANWPWIQRTIDEAVRDFEFEAVTSECLR